MTKQCDHKSVGMMVWHDDKLLLIERAKPPYGFAIPAGHVDDDALFEDAARRELEEEVGLIADSLELVIEGRKDTSCRRGGAWHYWKIYRVETSGELDRSLEETKQTRWASRDELQTLAKRTIQYIEGNITEEEWEQNPGLEVVMYEWFQKIGALD